MKYISTRGGIEPICFEEAVMTGMARDGGLLVPETIPDASTLLPEWKKLSYPQLAFEIIKLYSDIPEAELKKLIEKSYISFSTSEVTPVVKLNSFYILELFHGPTLAFKDVALQFLGNLFEYYLQKTTRQLNIIAATSGDTGSAAIYGVRGKNKIRIFVMHPHGRISRTQELQMTSVVDGNVFNIAVEGTFDDCQRILKKLFEDVEFKEKYSLGAVNSINWARILAQIVYYFYAAFRVMEETKAEKVRFAVPTGNFGDILAGFYAIRMGLPAGKLILATNENDILARFFNTGKYSIGPVHKTISPSMDIQVASNFERYIYYRYNGNSARVNELMKRFASAGEFSVEPLQSGEIDSLFVAGTANRKATLETIAQYYHRYNYLLDPHTAVGVYVGTQFIKAGEPLICLATAHPAKFSEAITEAIGKNIARHPKLDALHGLPTKCDVLPASLSEIKRYIEDKLNK
jgi:threonine synthase